LVNVLFDIEPDEKIPYRKGKKKRKAMRSWMMSQLIWISQNA